MRLRRLCPLGRPDGAREQHNQIFVSFFVAATSPGIEFPYTAPPTAPFESSGYRFSEFVKAIRLEPVIAAHASQFTMILADELFATVAAANLACFRHLRRVPASSWRVAWKGNLDPARGRKFSLHHYMR